MVTFSWKFSSDYFFGRKILGKSTGFFELKRERRFHEENQKLVAQFLISRPLVIRSPISSFQLGRHRLILV